MYKVTESRGSLVYLGTGKSPEGLDSVTCQLSYNGDLSVVEGWSAPSWPFKRGHLWFGSRCLLPGRNTALCNYIYKFFDRSFKSRVWEIYLFLNVGSYFKNFFKYCVIQIKWSASWIRPVYNLWSRTLVLNVWSRDQCQHRLWTCQKCKFLGLPDLIKNSGSRASNLSFNKPSRWF